MKRKCKFDRFSGLWSNQKSDKSTVDQVISEGINETQTGLSFDQLDQASTFSENDTDIFSVEKHSHCEQVDSEDQPSQSHKGIFLDSNVQHAALLSCSIDKVPEKQEDLLSNSSNKTPICSTAVNNKTSQTIFADSCPNYPDGSEGDDNLPLQNEVMSSPQNGDTACNFKVSVFSPSDQENIRGCDFITENSEPLIEIYIVNKVEVAEDPQLMANNIPLLTEVNHDTGAEMIKPQRLDLSKRDLSVSGISQIESHSILKTVTMPDAVKVPVKEDIENSPEEKQICKTKADSNKKNMYTVYTQSMFSVNYLNNFTHRI